MTRKASSVRFLGMRAQRRRFLTRVGASVLAMIAGALPYGLARLMAPVLPSDPGQQVPLPGALPDLVAFKTACIGCGMCGEVCPPRCIQFRRNDGGTAVNTPFINPQVKACTLCGKCMEICPTDALTVTPREKVNMGIAQIDRAGCYPWIDQGICGACVSVCPLGTRGIRFELWNQYRPVVERGCVGCGLCVEVCPHPSLPIQIVKRSHLASVQPQA